MRISSVTMFEQSVSSMNRQQGEFLKVSEQVASGRRVVNPSDDPQAASRAVGVDQSKAMTQQYADSRVSARNSLSQSESVLNSVSDAVTSAKTLLIQAASDTLSDADRQSVASELRGVYETLLGQANATDGNGRYLFGGYRDDSPPFVKDSSGAVQYVGDDRGREQRIDSSRLMEVSSSGAGIFQSVPSGADSVATADKDNTGSVTFKGPQVVDREAVDSGASYDITFSYDALATPPSYTYEVTDSAGGSLMPPVTGSYDPDASEPVRIEFGGLTMELEGQPADGDSIAVRPADHKDNTDLFTTLESALGVLENPAQNDAEKAALRNTLNTSMRKLDNSLDNVLTTRASMGARLNELDVVDQVGSNRLLNYEQTLSDLVDLDYAEAASEYSLRQLGLQASQLTFADLKDMSLFNYLR
ncbi:MAG TPA: flagellar hook-associated protein FlgL [Halomonas sp.]|nr:flagellar hook-associated protein FlgL [Halomonas sp.]